MNMAGWTREEIDRALQRVRAEIGKAMEAGFLIEVDNLRAVEQMLMQWRGDGEDAGDGGHADA